MKLEDIYTEWEKDATIDRTELSDEVLRIPKLHHKYFKMFTNERLILRKYEAEFKQLKLAKHEFFTMGPTEETHAKGWRLPPQGKIIRSDVNNYIDADTEVINLTLKIGIQQEKLDLLESVIKSLTNRGFNIKAAIDFEKFKVGI
tara:strand:+ start:208 stop:642 length:435 start_codon:yes stop_codon:yes gene_type:complete